MSMKADVPVFNKRLYATHGSVVFTSSARQILARNARTLSQKLRNTLNKSELYAMRCVVDGLKFIHKDEDFVKDILSHVVTLEKFVANEHVEKLNHEVCRPCFYIVTGAVKAMYNSSNDTQTRNVHQPNMLYSHGVGEYLGMVSAEGIHDDISSPTLIVTKESTELLRIDRHRFHQMISSYQTSLRAEMIDFIQNTKCILSKVSSDVIEKLLLHFSKVEVAWNEAVVVQDEASDFMYFVVSGRCELTRKVAVPEAGRVVKYHMGCREPYSYFAEECILSAPSSSVTVCTATTTSPSTFFKLNRTALDVIVKEQLYSILHDHAHQYPADEELNLSGRTMCIWKQYKNSVVSVFLNDVRTNRKQECGRASDAIKNQRFKKRDYAELSQSSFEKGSNFGRKLQKLSRRKESSTLSRTTIMIQRCTSIEELVHQDIPANKLITTPALQLKSNIKLPFSDSISNKTSLNSPTIPNVKTTKGSRNRYRSSSSNNNIWGRNIRYNTISSPRLCSCHRHTSTTIVSKVALNSQSNICCSDIKDTATMTNMEDSCRLSSNLLDSSYSFNEYGCTPRTFLHITISGTVYKFCSTKSVITDIDCGTPSVQTESGRGTEYNSTEIRRGTACASKELGRATTCDGTESERSLACDSTERERGAVCDSTEIECGTANNSTERTSGAACGSTERTSGAACGSTENVGQMIISTSLLVHKKEILNESMSAEIRNGSSNIKDLTTAAQQLTTTQFDQREKSNCDTDIPSTWLYEENALAKLNMAANQYRSILLRRRMESLVSIRRKRSTVGGLQKCQLANQEDDLFEDMLSQLTNTSLILLPRSNKS